MKDLLDFYTNAPLLDLGSEANRMRQERHPEGIVTFIVDRNINYTNVCVADCGFCAFYRRPKHGEGYTLSFEQIGQKIDETKALGGVQILIQGGHNPYIPFEWYLDLLRYIKTHHPIHIHGFSPSEVDFFAKVFRMDARDVIRELRGAGLDSIPGGGGEILVQRVRDIVAPKKAGADRWLEIMELAHNEGMKTSVTMMYGIGETLAERIEHLQRVRELQARTGGFTAFICWPLQPENTPSMSHMQRTDAVDYLRTVAMARIVLDNVPNLQSSWVTMGDEGGPACTHVRLQRFRLAHDRGKRRLGREHHAPDDHRGARAPHRRCRLHAAATTTGLHDSRGAGGSRRLSDAATGNPVRVGIGYDSHRFTPGGPMILGGCSIPSDVSLVGHSDGDAIAHAVTDAILGAAGAGDIGEMFADTDVRNRGRDSIEMLRLAVDRVRALGFVVHNADVTVVAERPKIGPYRAAIRSALAAALGIDASCVSVKGKTNEGMGWIGRAEGLACMAVASLAHASRD
jgi:cyclic dehypoxanthinyl futalosine synthase